MKRRFALSWFMFVAFQASAQFHTIFHYSVPEGLPSSEVYDVYQDKKGFLWFATDNGVSRFDGHQFEAFHVKDGLTDPVVFGFYEDEKGTLWFRTYSGQLAYFRGDEIAPYEFNHQLTQAGDHGLFNFIYDSRTDDLWFTLKHIFGKIDSTGQVSRQDILRPSLFIKSINGDILYGQDRNSTIRYLIVNEETFPISLTDSTENKFFNVVQCGKRIYVSIYKNIFEYHDHKVKRVFTSKHPIISLSKDKGENLWIGFLNHGVTQFGNGDNSGRTEFLKDKSVTRVFQDASSGFWFSTLESGVYYVPNFEIENYQLPGISRIKTVLSLNDTVMVGDQAGNLYFFDANNKKLLAKTTYKNAVYALFQDAYKNIWISAGEDILRSDSTFHPLNLYRKLIATNFSQDPDGSVWTFGGLRITHFDQSGNITLSRAENIIYRSILALDSSLYLAARTGLHIRDKNLKLLANPEAFSRFKITHIELLNDSIVILASQGNGLFFVNKGSLSFSQLDTDHQFIADNIYCLAKTDSTIYLGSEKGLIALPISGILSNELNFTTISHASGLLSDKINHILPVKETIWAFADNAFSVIPKSVIQSSPTHPEFYLKTASTNKDTVSSLTQLYSDPIRLAYNRNYISFTFGYISFSNQNIFIRYKISDDSEWIRTTERTLQFSSLSPDEYAMNLQYSLDNVHWNTPFDPIPFIIDSPWWMKWYTQLSGLVGLLVLGYLYFRYQQSIYKQKNYYLSIINDHQQKLIQSEIETLERERNRIAKELHDGVGTNLTAIKLMVSQLLKRHDEKQAAEVEEQFQITLKELKGIIYDLTPPSLERYGLFTALKNFITKLNKSITTVISIQFFGKEIKNYDFNIIIFRIIQELVSNSIKHASAKSITIHVNSFEDVLNIIYEDDGVGFSHDPVQGGLGLDNIESRIHSMKGSLKFDSGSHGTSYTIDIPLNLIKQTV